MKINSYGWVFLIFVLMVTVAWIGGEAGFQTQNAPVWEGVVTEETYDHVLGVPTYYGAAAFIANLAAFNIEGMPFVFAAVFDFLPFMCVWIIYRQIRGQD